MGEFSAGWLALREPADRAARSMRLTRAIADRLDEHRPIDVLDLGAGTGGNARYLSDKLPSPQRWLLVDHDPSLLARAPAGLATLSRDLNQAVHDAELFAGRAIVTASALLDLTSEDWLQALAARCRESRAAVLFALTYNGRTTCTPAEPEDESIRELVNRHQRIDKGFGAALGPDAAARAEALFAAAGYQMRREPSDWVLTPDAHDLQRQLIAGWAEAAAAIAPNQSTMIAGWKARRLAHLDANRSRLIVGHADLAGWLPRA